MLDTQETGRGAILGIPVTIGQTIPLETFPSVSSIIYLLLFIYLLKRSTAIKHYIIYIQFIQPITGLYTLNTRRFLQIIILYFYKYIA